MKKILLLFLTCFAATTFAAPTKDKIRSGTVWLDQDNSPIQAHGGGMLKHESVWYWYGEDKRNGYFPSPGVSCYSSKDLINWKHEGVVCPMWIQDGESIVPNTPGTFQTGTQRPVIERPKVIYNESTGKFVMWMHLEGHAEGTKPFYQFSSAGVAVSDSPKGPFKFVNCLRPTPPELHTKYSDETEGDQIERGSTFRDMALFKDDDGKAYVIYAAESNFTMHIAALTDDFCDVQEPIIGKTWNRIMIQDHREAPAPFKYKGRYYILTSACGGWNANAAGLYISDHILGPYAAEGNPCIGEGSDRTFMSQSTFVLPIDPEHGHFIFMADRWNPKSIGESRYIWLPFTFDNSDKATIEWIDSWKLSVFND